MDYQYTRKKYVVETKMDNKVTSTRTKKTIETHVIRERLKSEKATDDNRTPLKDITPNSQKHADTYPRNKIPQKNLKPESVRANIFPPPRKSGVPAKKILPITNSATQTSSREKKVGTSIKPITASLKNPTNLQITSLDQKYITRPNNASRSSSSSGAVKKSIHPQIKKLQKSENCSISSINNENNIAMGKESTRNYIEDSIICGSKIRGSESMVSKDNTDINLDNVTMMARKFLARQDITRVNGNCDCNNQNNAVEISKNSTILTKSMQATSMVDNKPINQSITIISGNSTYSKQQVSNKNKNLESTLNKTKDETIVESKLAFGTYCDANSLSEDSQSEDLNFADTTDCSKTLQEDVSNTSILNKSLELSVSSNSSSRRAGTPHHTKLFSSFGSSFESISEEKSLYHTLESSENISPIKPNMFTTNCTLILSAEEKKEAPKKTSLIRKLKNKREKFDECTPYTLDIYVSDYIEDIIKYLLTINNKYMLKRNFLLAFNPSIESRSQILNWIMKMQKHLYLSTEQIFLVTRLYDNILARVEIPRNMYQLVVLAISWIVAKCYSTNVLSVSRILKLCANAYTPKQLLNMEMKILKVFKFSFVMNDPGIFGTYYMNKLRIDCEHQIRFCVSYVLESFALCHHFSTFHSSELAAAALYLTLRCLYPSEHIYQRISGILAYHHPTEIRDISELMYIQLQKISDPKSEVGEPFRKYSMLEMKKVSILLQSCVKPY